MTETKKRKHHYTLKMQSDPEYRRQQYDRINATRKAKRDERKASSGIDHSKIGTGICAHFECSIKLSMYNETNFCSSHYSLLFRKGFIKEKDLF